MEVIKIIRLAIKVREMEGSIGTISCTSLHPPGPSFFFFFFYPGDVSVLGAGGWCTHELRGCFTGCTC